MNTEQLTQFPMGVITEADVKEHDAKSQSVSNEVKTWTKAAALIVLGTVLICAVATYAMSATLGGQLPQVDRAKALLLIWVSPEKGEDYILDRMTVPKR